MQFYRNSGVKFRKFARSWSGHVAAREMSSHMSDLWSNWIEAVRFTCEAQGVISVRLMLFASGAPNAADEARRMIPKRSMPFPMPARPRSVPWLNGLGIYAAAERAYAPLGDRVRANSARLVRDCTDGDAAFVMPS